MSDRELAMHHLWRETVAALIDGRDHDVMAFESVLVECLSLTDEEFLARFPNAFVWVAQGCN
ncbi:hypothetical protein [Candidatus Solirubrobacter pratensis]|uniref:hypothetical protein n=1 Tax=Candidatus Solirubrobacter pratensis TaxID=1298857 RepID=UPI0012DBDD73|nr:hypothetical protein [Candidatus Solirubrobacter pratensis]